MAKQTIQQKLVACLEARGAKVVQVYPGRNGRNTIKMTHPGSGATSELFYFIGPAGALRSGRIRTGSIALERLRRGLLASTATTT